ncbi:B3/B4 domain-containing protein [Mesorhizobium sp. 1B3]|uniref:B3/B4 domain-containing protein n=1 Tax=Mesorhizobium sp. 1B3 TaxID=3243599 RepID=UPI003D972748
MQFSHSSDIWEEFPELSAGVLHVQGITPYADVGPSVNRFNEIARSRLAGGPESELPEIQAWRRIFSRMGLKPTQYRCASEALLRRFRQDGSLPRIHPMVDLCNAVSLAFAIPVAAIDLANVTAFLQVRHAAGNEEYMTFSGEIERPEPREVVFADGAGKAHARRWTNRQSGLSAVRKDTSSVLIVAEAVHATASADVARLIATLAEALKSLWQVTPRSTLLDKGEPRFEF